VSGRRGSIASVAASASSVCGEARSRSGMPRVTFATSPLPVADATCIGADCSLSASAACSALKYGSPKPISLSRAGEPRGNFRSVTIAEAEGTTVTAWLLASQATLR